MKFVLKIFALPFALIFTVLAAILTFIFSISSIFFGIASGLIFIGAVILFITGEPIGGIAFVVVSFLVSPLGLPAIAGKLVGLIDSIARKLRGFITS